MSSVSNNIRSPVRSTKKFEYEFVGRAASSLPIRLRAGPTAIAVQAIIGGYVKSPGGREKILVSLLLDEELQTLPHDQNGDVYWKTLAALFFGNREVTGKNHGSAGDNLRYELTFSNATMDIYLQPFWDKEGAVFAWGVAMTPVHFRQLFRSLLGDIATLPDDLFLAFNSSADVTKILRQIQGTAVPRLAAAETNPSSDNAQQHELETRNPDSATRDGATVPRLAENAASKAGKNGGGGLDPLDLAGASTASTASAPEDERDRESAAAVAPKDLFGASDGTLGGAPKDERNQESAADRGDNDSDGTLGEPEEDQENNPKYEYIFEEGHGVDTCTVEHSGSGREGALVGAPDFKLKPIVLKITHPVIPKVRGFPDRKAVLKSLNDESHFRVIVLTATACLDQMLSMILGVPFNDSFDSKIKMFGNLPKRQSLSSSPTTDHMDDFRQWRNPVAHTTTQQLEDFDGLGTTKETVLVLFRSLLAHLESVWDADRDRRQLEHRNQEQERRIRELEHRNQSLEHRNHTLRQENGTLRSLINDGGFSGSPQARGPRSPPGGFGSQRHSPGGPGFGGRGSGGQRSSANFMHYSPNQSGGSGGSAGRGSGGQRKKRRHY